MRGKPLALLLGLAALAAAASVAAGSASSSSSSILTVGTTFYIDTLNPFVGIETQDDTAYGMVFPQLVQYGPGLKLVGDWASGWTHSRDGLVWTFHLRTGGKWSDGVPLTAHDAVWTIDTILANRNGYATYLAQILHGLKSVSAPNPSTLVLTYSIPVAGVLANLEQMYFLPEHVWSKYKGAAMKSFRPEQHLPFVSAGPYTITQFQEKGTTVFKPNPYFYGPKSHAAAVALTYYTNPTAMLADLQAGKLAFVDAVPYQDAAKVKGMHGVTLTTQAGDEVTNLGINSNPQKTANRELLLPAVREALEYAVPRQKIASIVFGGNAKPWANILSAWSGPSGWLNPAVKPLPYDPAKANGLLDSLGYKRGGDGTRVVPATTGAHAQQAHPMSYSVIVPNDLDFDGNLQYQILATAFSKVGIKLHEVAGGDGTQAYTLITAPKCTYRSADFYTWYWHPYIDPNFNLSVVTRTQWCDNSDTGMSDSRYDAWWAEQSMLVDVKARQALVWKMEAYVAAKRPYIQLVDTDMITAHASSWTGFMPTLWGYSKLYFTSPHPAG